VVLTSYRAVINTMLTIHNVVMTSYRAINNTMITIHNVVMTSYTAVNRFPRFSFIYFYSSMLISPFIKH